VSFLDRDRNVIVLRVVYDGPPEAGKTTSLRALAGGLGQSLYTPAEQEGRTLFFDWMDYTGGRFEGYQIRCQIVSVPGQRALRKRRLHLLRDADVVVHVADSRRDKLDVTIELLGELPKVLAGKDGPPVGVIIQANKRDLPDAVPVSELRERVHAEGWSMGIVESVASGGTGIRETFVFAVRLALDRVREQIRTNTLPVRTPDIDSGDALFEDIKSVAIDGEPEVALAAPVLEQVLAENDDAALTDDDRWDPSDARGAPWPPDISAPSGAIWPPVDGRLMLHEATAAPMTTHRVANGFEAGIGGAWRAYSGRSAVYADLEAGREMLIRWARLHVACAGLVSSSRCIVLAATGDGRWRLWQIVRAEKSMRDHLDGISSCSVQDAAQRIVDAVASIGDLIERSEAAPWAGSCSLATVGRGDRGAMYIGLMPMKRNRTVTSEAIGDRLGAELSSIVAATLPARRGEVSAAIGRMPIRGSLRSAIVDRILSQMTRSWESHQEAG
jgi:signal recognition particle receptor subunit beta